MKAETSPFTPGRPVQTALFEGRKKEIERVNRKLREASQRQRVEAFFLAGERGIGKTSLAGFARRIAEREHGFVGIHVFLGGASSNEEVVRKVLEGFLQMAHDRRDLWDKTKEFFKNRVDTVGAYGLTVQFRPSGDEMKDLSDNFFSSLAGLYTRLAPEVKGLFLILDDINGISRSAGFANFLKSLIDEASTSDRKLPMVLLLAGLYERREELLAHQPSLDRAFEVLDIRPMSDAEVEDFFQRAFASAGVQVDSEALDELVQFSGGWPVFMHELGDAVFYQDSDERITRDDSLAGVAAAAENVGKKFLERQVYEAIRSPKYKSILRKLPRLPGLPDIQRKELAKVLTADESKVVDNFLRKMRELGVLTPAGPMGTYRFTKDLYHVYILLESFNSTEQAKLPEARSRETANR